ncbi:MAG TPA: hypothetical protein VJX67_01680, partial [Blastocatellia bacterium]|nr:hypothetical protein [Blastocatellia bacterium]
MRQSMIGVRSCLLALFFTFVAALPVLAGGFWITVEAPGSTGNSESGGTVLPGGTVLIVRTAGCVRPEATTVTATAEGLVKGERKSVVLDLTAIAPGVYAVKRQWPAEGAWVLTITGGNSSLVRSLILRLGPDGSIPSDIGVADKQGGRSQMYGRKLSKQEIESALRAIPGKTPEAMSAPGSAFWRQPRLLLIVLGMAS